MKILFFIDSLTAGGKERRLSELLKGLRHVPKMNFEIVVMNEEIHYKEIMDSKLKIHYLLRRTKKDISVFWKFFKICKDYKPDLVHTWDDMTSVIAVPACRLLSIKLVNGMVVDTPVKRNFSNKYWRRAQLTFPFSEIIIGNSQAGLKAYGAPLKKSCCIYNGMDFNRFIKLKDPLVLRKEVLGIGRKPLFIVGMVAAFEERKDYNTLIEGAVSLITLNRSICFVLVGDGSKMQEIKSKVPHSLKENIIFLGRRKDVESIVNIFDVGVLLTNSQVHGEGISNSIIEYMALSKPVIATIGGGTNEVVYDNKNGYLIKPGNSSHFVQLVQKLYNDKRLIKRLGESGKRTVQNGFDINIMTAKYISVYKKIAKEL